MKRWQCILLSVFFASLTCGFAQEACSFTDSLVQKFHASWNANDLDEMLNQLQPDAFFKSPHQLRIGREEMAATVLLVNPPVIRDCRSEEWVSHRTEFLAWSIGRLYCNTYDKEGNIAVLGAEKNTEYTYLFTKDEHGHWKVQMLLYHE